MKRFCILGLGLLSIVSLVGCNEEKVSYDPTSVVDAINQLKNIENFTLDVYNTSLGDKGSIYFNENYYYDVLNSYGYIKSNKGVFQFDVDNKGNYIANEIKDEFKGELYKSGQIYTFNGFSLNMFDASSQKISITDKDNRQAFLNLVGEDSGKYINISSLVASFDSSSKEITMNCVFNDESYIKIDVVDILSTKEESVEDFKKSAKPFVPEENISAVRNLMKSNNYARYIYDDSKNLIGKEYFTEQYYCLNYFSGQTIMYNTGYVSLVDKSYNGTVIENGSYLVTPGAGEDAAVNVFLAHYAFKETNMPEIMQYPSFLEMFSYLNLFEYSEDLGGVMFSTDAILTVDVYNNFGVANAGFTSVSLSGCGYKVEKISNDYVFNIKLFGYFDGTFGQFDFEFREFGKTAHLGIENFLSSLDNA